MTARPVLLSVALVAGATALVSFAQSDGPAAAVATASVVCDDQPGTEPASQAVLDSYTAINPSRLVDTRDGTGGVSEALGAGCTLRLDLSDSIVPGDAEAVGISLTGVAAEPGFLTAYPCAVGRPGTSNLNVRVGIGTPNFVAGLLDSSRALCIYSNAGSDVVVDLAGWWSPGGDRIHNIDPVRAYDTRELPGAAKLPANSIRNVPLGGPVVPDDATAVIVNLTSTDAEAQGWVSVYPCGNTPPLSSNVNLKPDEARAVTAIVGLGKSGEAKGQLCIQSNITSHIVVDVNGYYAPAPGFGPSAAVRPQAGVRLADSRDGTGGWTRPFRAGEVRSFDPVSASPLATSATGVMLNVTATGADRRGNVRVYPCTSTARGEVTPTSAVNFTSEGSVANLVPISVSSNRLVCVYTSQPTDVVVDLFGVITAPDGSLAEELSFGDVGVWPPFDPSAPDYGIRCADGNNSIAIQLDLLPNATATVGGVATPSGETTQTLVTDDVLPVTLRRGTQTSEYFFRCLPSDFPVYEVERPGEPTPGWYLTTAGQGASPSGEFTVILDHYGAPVWYKRVDEQLLNFQRRADGTLLASEIGRFFGAPGDDLRHRISDLDGTLLEARGLGAQPTTLPDDAAREQFAIDFPVDHHEHGDLLDESGDPSGWTIVSYALRQNVDLTGLGPDFNVDDSVVDGVLLEFGSSGDLDWEWNSKDHFPENFASFPQRFANIPLEPNGGEVDTVHINSFQKLPDGDYLVSARHYDAVFRIDYPSGNVEWVLGGKQELLDPSQRIEIVGDPFGGVLRPHDARLVGNRLTVFDNRTDTTQSARAVTYELNGGETRATLVREIRQPAGLPSPAQGSHRVADDGSALIGWGTSIPNFQEYDVSGDLLLSITQLDPANDLPDGFAYRIVKEPPTSFDRAELRTKAGGNAESP